MLFRANQLSPDLKIRDGGQHDTMARIETTRQPRPALIRITHPRTLG